MNLLRLRIVEVMLFISTGLLCLQFRATKPESDGTLNKADQGTADMSKRIRDFPNTYIDTIDVDMTGPQPSVRIVWAGTKAISQERGPFRCSPGKGTGENNCDDPDESGHFGSCCTPKGTMLVQGFNDFLPSLPKCKFVTWVNIPREVGLHSHDDVPNHPASHGCVRLDESTAQLIHNNSIVGQTKVTIGGAWYRPDIALDRKKLLKQLVEHDGKHSRIHTDANGVQTIGIGYRLDHPEAAKHLRDIGAELQQVTKGSIELSNDQIDHLLQSSLDEALRTCRLAFPHFSQLSDVRQRVLIELSMAFGAIEMNRSTDVIRLVNSGDFASSAAAMEEYSWFQRSKAKCEILAEMMRTGCDPIDLSSPIIDSQMTREEALSGIDTGCPQSTIDRLVLVNLSYYSFDNRLHRGQLLIDRDLKSDIEYVFRVGLENRFPIGSVIPLAHPKFRKHEAWDDTMSMQANNTTAFCYRQMADQAGLSLHALGRAIDVNPMQNPYIEAGMVRPMNASYVLATPGTLGPESPVVQAFLDRGWIWGGRWRDQKDFQHFSKGTDATKF